MPRLDGTGPNGEGSKTGRGLGNCNPNQENVKTNNEEQKIIINQLIKLYLKTIVRSWTRIRT